METIYNVDYFIKKFEDIPDSEIGTGSLASNCSLHHCGIDGYDYPETPTEESKQLMMLFGWDGKDIWADGYVRVYEVNDGNGQHGKNYRHLKTPKQRILAALYDIKAKQQPTLPEVKEVIKYVTVDASVRELQEKVLSEN